MALGRNRKNPDRPEPPRWTPDDGPEALATGVGAEGLLGPGDPNSDAESEAARQRDRSLVGRVLAGDKAALEQLIVRLQCVPRIVRALNERRGRPLGEHEIADLNQDILILVWRKLKTFEGRATLETWTYRFCALEAMNRFRRFRKRRRLESAGLDGVADRMSVPTVPSPVDADVLFIGLDELGPPQSVVIRMKHFDGRTFREIADLLAIPANTAKTHYYRGLDWMRQRIRSLGEDGSQ